MSMVKEFINHKQLINGIRQGLGYLLIGTGVGFISSIARSILNNVKQQLFVCVTIDSKDKSYEALLYWLSLNGNVKQSRNLNVETVYNSSGKNPTVIFVPSVGKHRVSYKGRYIWVERVRDSTFDMASGAPFESIVLTVFGRDGHIIQQLVSDSMELSLRRDEGKTVIYISSGGSWERFGTPRAARSLDSVILPIDVKNGLLNDIKDFLNSEEWFRNRGIPYRRGYLLHGPPGNGKSSLVNAIAGELNLDICIVSLSNADMDDHQFNNLLNNAPPKSILLIEDVDAAFNDRSSRDTLSSNRLTFSGMLNALDGVASQEGRILFMTTNHIEKLDQALIRDGRVDLKIQISNATKLQSQQLFTYFYSLDRQDANSNDMAKQFSSNIIDYQLSMSQIQGFLLQYKKSPQKALKHVNQLVPVSLIN